MNKMIKPYFLFLVVFLTISSSLSAQFGSRGKEFNYVDAENFYKANNFYDALPLYQLLLDKYPKIIEYRLKIGICHLNLADSTEKAIVYLNQVHDKKSKEIDVLFYLGKAYAINYRFDKAKEIFNEALTSDYVSTKFKEVIPHFIEQCDNAILLMKDSVPVTIVNIGEPINSVNNEYSPTVSADETTLIFTYKGIKSKGQRQDFFNRSEVNGNFYEDIHVSTFVSGAWTKPEPIGDSINTDFHEASISLSPDGQKLFLYQDVPDFSGDILEVNKKNGKWGVPRSLAINSESWEGHAAISPNGKFMIFSSERDGGLGNRDLYSAVLLEDSTWGAVKNLGANVNTIYNDDAPFIHSDGVTFNFSSEGHNSMGGYDIFESKIITDSTFLAPRNIGYPINTPANDIFFYVSGKGNAYYSSAKRGGFGQQDIYVINVKDIITSKPVLLVKGVITKNRSTAGADIIVRTKLGKDLGVYHSDKSDGKYQFYVDLKDSYEITYKTEGFSDQVIDVDANQYSEYAELEKDVEFLVGDVTIEGVALAKEDPYIPLKNIRIQITNKDKTFSQIDSTDEKGNYKFEDLPNDDYFVMFLDAEDEKNLNDSIYFFKGRITMKQIPYANATINEMLVSDDGTFIIEVLNKTYFRKLSNSNSKSKINDMTMEELLSNYGDQEVTNLIYRIQVGAYSNPINYNSNHLKKLGEVSGLVLDDGITRFMIGEFKTLRAANTFHQKVLATGQKDAFILMFLNEKRTYLEELVETKLFK